MAQGGPDRLRPRNTCHSAVQGWQVVSLTHRSPLPQEKSLVLIFRGRIDPRAHGSAGNPEKNPGDRRHRDSILGPFDQQHSVLINICHRNDYMFRPYMFNRPSSDQRTSKRKYTRHTRNCNKILFVIKIYTHYILINQDYKI